MENSRLKALRIDAAGLYYEAEPGDHQTMLGTILEFIVGCLRDMVVGMLGHRAEVFLSKLLKRLCRRNET